MNYRDTKKIVTDLVGNKDSSLADYLSTFRLVKNADADLAPHMREIKVAFLSSFTIQGLSNVYTVQGLFHDLIVRAYNAPYNQFSQEVFSTKSDLYTFAPDLIYLLVDAPDYIDENHLENVIEKLVASTEARIVSANFLTSKNAKKEKVVRLNAKLTDLQSRHNTVIVADLQEIINQFQAGEVWYTHYTEAGDLRVAPHAFPTLSESLLSYAIARAGNTKKCLVVDLDGTLWDGIIGEDGLQGIKPNRSLQEHILRLYTEGVILCINSKNNQTDAFEVFDHHSDMVLRRDHFAAWRINWNSKDTNIIELAQELNIGTDSMVFVDDDPFQRNLVGHTLPEVSVLDPSFLQRYVGFHKFAITTEDLHRGAMYVEERKRRELKDQIKDEKDFFKKLALTVHPFEVTEEVIERVSQMTQKTNQFNMTTKRYSVADLQQQLARGWKIYVLDVKDVFGQYGITGMCIIEPTRDTWRIDSLLFSCRILGRGIEFKFFSYIYNEAKKTGVRSIEGVYVPTAKNGLCKTFFDEVGFLVTKRGATETHYILDVAKSLKVDPEYIAVLAQ